MEYDITIYTEFGKTYFRMESTFNLIKIRNQAMADRVCHFLNTRCTCVETIVESGACLTIHYKINRS